MIFHKATQENEYDRHVEAPLDRTFWAFMVLGVLMGLVTLGFCVDGLLS